MNIPSPLYHGTFWSEGTGLDSKGLSTSYGYVSATPHYEWAIFFAMITRWKHRRYSGKLTIYTIDVDKLPRDVREKCIPPNGTDPRVSTFEGLRLSEEEMREERIKVGDWRFPYIPLESIIATEENYEDAQPNLDVFAVSLYRPR